MDASETETECLVFTSTYSCLKTESDQTISKETIFLFRSHNSLLISSYQKPILLRELMLTAEIKMENKFSWYMHSSCSKGHCALHSLELRTQEYKNFFITNKTIWNYVKQSHKEITAVSQCELKNRDLRNSISEHSMEPLIVVVMLSQISGSSFFS